MRWSNFVEIAENSNLHGYSRLFSNWYRVQQKLAATSANTVLHRISPKRVVIEITDAKSRKHSSQRTRPLLFLTGGVVLSLGAICSLAIFDANGTEIVSREPKQEVFDSTTFPSTCKTVSDLAGLEIADLRQFVAHGWIVRTYSEARTLGSVWFVNFEAECSGQVVDGLLTAQEIEVGYRILKLTPT